MGCWENTKKFVNHEPEVGFKTFQSFSKHPTWIFMLLKH